MTNHRAGAAAAASPASPNIRRHCSPDRNRTKRPLAATSRAVPRSGWRAISNAGTARMAPATSDASRSGGRRRGCRYQAIIIGTASFMISEGWKRSTPKSSQRLVLRPVPKTQVANTSASAQHVEPRCPDPQNVRWHLAEHQQDQQAERDAGSLAINRIDVSARCAVQDAQTNRQSGPAGPAAAAHPAAAS